MEGLKLARPYAKALFSLSTTQEQSLRYLDELKRLLAVLQEEDRLFSILISKRISKIEKKSLLNKLFGEDLLLFPLSKNLRGLLEVLLEKNRLVLIAQISRVYEALYYEKYGFMRAVVKTVTPLSEEEQGRLIKVLDDTYHKKTILSPEIDEAILGGLTIQIGDIVYDGSLRTQFKQLAERLVK